LHYFVTKHIVMLDKWNLKGPEEGGSNHRRFYFSATCGWNCLKRLIRFHLEAVYMSFHFGANLNIFAISQLQTTRNEFHFVLTDRYEFISGSLRLQKYFISPWNENSCIRPLSEKGSAATM